MPRSAAGTGTTALRWEGGTAAVASTRVPEDHGSSRVSNGAATGLLVKDYVGKDANQEVWKFPCQAPHLWFQLLAGQKVCSYQQSLFGQPAMPALVSQLPDMRHARETIL